MVETKFIINYQLCMKEPIRHIFVRRVV